MNKGSLTIESIYAPDILQTCSIWKDVIIKEEANIAFSEAMVKKIEIHIINEPKKERDKWIFVIEINPLDIISSAWLRELTHITVVTEQSMPQLMEFAIKLKNLEVSIDELGNNEQDRFEGIILTKPDKENLCRIQLNIANPTDLIGKKLWMIEYSNFPYRLMEGNVDKVLQISDELGMAILQESLDPNDFTSDIKPDKFLEHPNLVFYLLEKIEQNKKRDKQLKNQLEFIQELLNLMKPGIHSKESINKLEYLIHHTLGPDEVARATTKVRNIIMHLERGHLNRELAINELIEILYPSEQTILRNELSQGVIQFISGAVSKNQAIQHLNITLNNANDLFIDLGLKPVNTREQLDFTDKIDEQLSNVGFGKISRELAVRQLLQEICPVSEDSEMTRYISERNRIDAAKELMLDLSGNSKQQSLKLSQVVVIQGPPGAGKTSYIAFLMELLFDLYEPLYELALKQKSLLHKIPKMAFVQYTNVSAINTAYTAAERNQLRNNWNELHNLVGELKLKSIPFVIDSVQNLPTDLKRYSLEYKAQQLKKESKHNSSNPGITFEAAKHQVFEESMFIITTTVGAIARYRSKSRRTQRPFSLIIIDEASQMPLPLFAGLSTLSRSVVALGDQNQLPPVVKSSIVKINHMNQSTPMKKTIYDIYPANKIKMLKSQYRGRFEIFGLISLLFYHGQLITGCNVKQLNENLPILRILNVSDVIDQDQANLAEVKRIEQDINEIIKNLRMKGHQGRLRIGIITPYRNQARCIKKHLNIKQDMSVDISIESGTVHVSQGRTYDWVYFTVGRTQSKPFLQLLSKQITQIKQSFKHDSNLIFQEAHRVCFEELWDYPDLRGFLYATISKCESELRGFNQNHQTNARKSNEFAARLLNVAFSRSRYGLSLVFNEDGYSDNVIFMLLKHWIDEYNKYRIHHFSNIWLNAIHLKQSYDMGKLACGVSGYKIENESDVIGVCPYCGAPYLAYIQTNPFIANDFVCNCGHLVRLNESKTISVAMFQEIIDNLSTNSKNNF